MRQFLALLAACVLAATAAPADDKADRKQLQGTWTVVKVEQAGVALPVDPAAPGTFTFTADEAAHEDGGGKKVASFALDPSKAPAHIDLVSKGGSDKGKAYR